MNAVEFREAMAVLPEPPNDSHPPLWDFWRHDLWQRVISGSDPDDFLGWPCIYHTMLQNHWPDAITAEFNALPEDMRIHAIMPTFGYPKDYHANTPFSRNMIHQAYHVHRFQSVTGKSVKDMSTIVEFGGGFGAMALMMDRLGFRGDYIIYDLPEFSLLQEFYLSKFDIRRLTTFSDMSEAPIVKPDLLIACYSLSETDYLQRRAFLEQFPAENYLLLFSNVFEEYDNLGFFRRYAEDHNNKRWELSHLTHLPPESWYLFGWTQ